MNPNRDLTAAFYTDTMICKQIMSELPNFDDKSHIRIFRTVRRRRKLLPFIADKYKDKEIVEFYLVDIDENELKIAELIFETYFREKYPNTAIIYINDDYLQFPISGKKFDLVIGNPLTQKLQTANYRHCIKNSAITKAIICLFGF